MARRAIHVDGIVPVARGYPAAVVAGGFVFVSGMRGGRLDRTMEFDDLPESFRSALFSGFPLAEDMEAAFAADGWYAHENLDRVLTAAGSDASQVLRLHVWLRDKRVFPVYERIRMAWQKVPAPSSCLGIGEVAGRFGRGIGLEALAVVPGENAIFPERSAVRTFDNKEFPSAAYYSQAVRCGPLVSLAGHIPIETNKPGKPVIAGFDDVPEAGRRLATGRSHPDSRQGPIAAQTWFCYDKIRDNLAAQGLDMRDIKHVAVMLQDLRDVGTFHRVHRQFFPDNPPALIIAGFNEVGHRGTRIEIEPTAIDPKSKIDVSAIDWPFASPLAAPAGVKIGPLWLFSGIIGSSGDRRLVRQPCDLGDDIGQRVAEDLARFERAPGFATQCWASWTLLKTLCGNAGLRLDQLAKTTVYLRNPSDMWIYEEIREAFLPAAARALPAVEFVAIQGPGPVPEAQVQIEATAVEA